MQISQSALNTLKNRESLRLTAYADSAGVWTIGYGATYYQTGKKVQKGDTITKQQAYDLLAYHVGISANSVNQLITSTLKQGQFDALVSFVFNVGETNFKSSNLRKVVNTNPNNIEAIKSEFLKWVYVTVNGVKIKLNGLVNRRNEEIEMYTNGAVKGNFFFWFAVVVLIAFIYKKLTR